MRFDTVLSRLEAGLRQPLPGTTAHALMAPNPRRSWPDGFSPASIRHAAGLLLLFPIETTAYLVLTVRSDSLGRHGGQVSLPGGVAEPGESFEEAALSEAHEEVALAPGLARILGRLTPLDIPVSGFRLHPIVAFAKERPVLQPADGEVARILEVPLAALADPGHRVQVVRVRDAVELAVPAFRIEETEIWGATAMVLAELLALVS